MKITRHIPNAITCMNLLSGCVAVILALAGNYYGVVCCIALSAIFDFCDGFAARLLHAYSPMGKELDSLADLVSFGLAPGMLLLNVLQTTLPADYNWAAYIALMIPVFSALRLAKFNIDDRQTTSFLGLPVPANALFWVGVCHFSVRYPEPSLWLLIAVIAIVPLFSWLLVSEIPMFSLKFANYRFTDNAMRYIFLALSVILLASLGIAGLAAVIGLYIILSTIGQTKK